MNEWGGGERGLHVVRVREIVSIRKKNHTESELKTL